MTNTHKAKIHTEWLKTTIGNVVEKFGDGGTPSRNNVENFGGKIPWVVVQDINKDIVGTKENLSETGLKNSSAKLWPVGTVILSFGATIGEVGIAKIELTTKQGIAGLVPNQKISSEFLYYILKSLYQKLNQLASGSTIKEIRPSIVSKFEILLPPKLEQDRITKILSHVDEDIQATQKVIDQTERVKKALMKDLFTKGIGHTKFKDSDLGMIPENWDVLNGDSISSLITKGASPKWQGFEYQQNGTLFVTSENVRNGFINLTKQKFLPLAFHTKLKKSQLDKNDILINIVGASIGRSCLYESEYKYANINQAVCLLRVTEKNDSSYLIQYLQLDTTIDRLLGSRGGSARPNLSLSDIRSFKFLIPPLREQQQIASILSSVDKKITAYRDKKDALEQVKNGLMHDLLSGKVRATI